MTSSGKARKKQNCRKKDEYKIFRVVDNIYGV